MNLSEFAAQFERTVLPLKKKSSVTTIRSQLNLLLTRLGSLELEQFDYAVVQQFVTDLSLEKGPKTVRNYWGLLHNLLHRAEKAGLVSRVPQPDLPPLSYEDQRWLTLEEMRALIKASPVPALDALLAETGARVGEARALRSTDLKNDLTLEIHESLFRSQRGTPKTRSAVRVISISSWLYGLLAPQAESNLPLFRTRAGKPWADSKVNEHIHTLCDRVGIPPAGAHAYRRGNITAMVSMLGVHEKVASYRVGHKPKSLTLGLYCRPVPGFDRDCANRLGELLSG